MMMSDIFFLFFLGGVWLKSWTQGRLKRQKARFLKPFPSFLPHHFCHSHSDEEKKRSRSMSSTRRRPSSSNSLLESLKEPPQNFFPSKDEFLRLVAVLAIATSVAVACNMFVTTLINRQPKPFCDTHYSHSPDSISGEPHSVPRKIWKWNALNWMVSDSICCLKPNLFVLWVVNLWESNCLD